MKVASPWFREMVSAILVPQHFTFHQIANCTRLLEKEVLRLKSELDSAVFASVAKYGCTMVCDGKVSTAKSLDEYHLCYSSGTGVSFHCFYK